MRVGKKVVSQWVWCQCFRSPHFCLGFAPEPSWRLPPWDPLMNTPSKSWTRLCDLTCGKGFCLSPALRTALYIVNVNILESQLRLDSVPPMHYHWLRLLCCKQSPVVAQSSFYVNNSLGLCSGRPHGKVLNRKNRTVPPLSGIMIQSKDYTAEEYRGRQTLVWFSAF